MSWEAVTWANGQKLKKSYEQIVLLVLANCADPNGEAFVKWPGRDHWWIYLSQRTRLPKSSLFRHLNTLVALGLGERSTQVLADGSRRPTFKLNLDATFDIDLPGDAERYQAAFAKASPEDESPVGTEHGDDPQGDENDSHINDSHADETTIAPQSPVGTEPPNSQSPVGTDPFPVLRPQEDSLPCSKDSPLPPSGGDHALDELWEQFVKSWGEPIQKMGWARTAWDRVPTAKRSEVVASAKGYWAFRRAQSKPPTPQSAQSFLRDSIGWAQWLRYVPESGNVASSIMTAFPTGTPEARAIAVLYDIAGKGEFLRGVMTRNGAVNYPRPMTPRLLALAQAPAKDAWVVLTHKQASAWENNLLREAVTVQVRHRLREESRAPWPWPPSVDGKLYTGSTGPPLAGLSDQELADFK